MPRLLLVDAYAFIYRAFYAFYKMNMATSKGLNTSAIYGFVVTIEDLIKRLNPTHIAVAFDPKGKTFRHEAYEQYKAQRPDTPEDIHRSVPYIKTILEAMNIQIVECEGFEADDVIGTLAKQGARQGFEVFMATPDKDYGQLVEEHIFMYRPRHNGGYEQMGIAEVCDKYQLTSQEQVIDLLGLMGDASDNIPGCDGVGEKTAIKLLQQFSSIDNLLANTDQLKGAIKQKIESQAEQIRFSRFLATIRTDVPITFSAEQYALQPYNKEALIAIYRELEFRSFLRKLTADTDISQQATETNQPTATGETQDIFSENIASQPTETLSVTMLTAMPKIKDRVAIAVVEENIIVERDLFSSLQEPQLRIYLSADGKGVFSSLLNKDIVAVLESADIQKIGFDLKNDYKLLRKHQVKLLGSLYDITVAHYILYSEKQHSVEQLTETYLNLLCPDIIEARVAASFLLPQKLQADKHPLFLTEMQLIPVLADMELSGVRFDNHVLAEAASKIRAELLELEEGIVADAGVEFNIASPRQVGEILFDHLRLDPKAKKTKGGHYVTSEETLLAIQDRHPIVAKILEHRELKKLLSGYLDALPQLADPVTGKVHTTYNQTITATGRLSSSNPNLQNLPIRSERGRDIRRAVIADKDCLFLSADYSQIELRLMAHFSQDKHLIAAFQQGQDIHAATAAKIFQVPIEEVTPDMRRKAKTANFGIIYGISAFGLSQQLGVSRSEAKEFIDNYFLSFPTITNYIEQQKQLAHEQGYVETLFHRRRYLPDINSRNPNIRQYAERNAVNTPIQGTAADIIKMAMINIYNRLQRESLHTTMIMQVHDELCFNVPAAEADIAKALVVEEMQNIVSLSVPLIAEAGIGHNWLEAH